MSRPIQPHEVLDQRVFPDEVFDVFNALIAKHALNGQSVVGQNEIMAALCGALQCDREAILKAKWLNIEDHYRAAGWKVEYDKPGYNETYEPTFTFTAKP